MPDLLDHLPSDIIRELLYDLGLGDLYDSEDWPIFVENHPNTPDQLICVYNTTGILNDCTSFGDYSEHYGIQIKLRSTTETVGFYKANDISRTLDALTRTVVTLEGKDYLVHCCDRKGSVIPLGPEPGDQHRLLFTVNYVVPITVSEE